MTGEVSRRALDEQARQAAALERMLAVVACWAGLPERHTGDAVAEPPVAGTEAPAGPAPEAGGWQPGLPRSGRRDRGAVAAGPPPAVARPPVAASRPVRPAGTRTQDQPAPDSAEERNALGGVAARGPHAVGEPSGRGDAESRDALPAAMEKPRERESASFGEGATVRPAASAAGPISATVAAPRRAPETEQQPAAITARARLAGPGRAGPRGHDRRKVVPANEPRRPAAAAASPSGGAGRMADAGGGSAFAEAGMVRPWMAVGPGVAPLGRPAERAAPFPSAAWGAAEATAAEPFADSVLEEAMADALERAAREAGIDLA